MFSSLILHFYDFTPFSTFTFLRVPAMTTTTATTTPATTSTFVAITRSSDAAVKFCAKELQKIATFSSLGFLHLFHQICPSQAC